MVYGYSQSMHAHVQLHSSDALPKNQPNLTPAHPPVAPVVLISGILGLSHHVTTQCKMSVVGAGASEREKKWQKFHKAVKLAAFLRGEGQATPLRMGTEWEGGRQEEIERGVDSKKNGYGI